MKLVIVSDSHGNVVLQQQFLDQISSFFPDLVIHLGDDYKDTEAIIQKGYPIYRVPGTWREQYKNPMIDNRVFEDIEGWRFFLTHTPTAHYNDLPEDRNPEDVLTQGLCDVFCHGHTHEPRVEKQGGVWIINPGHTKASFDRGFPPTYILGELTKTSFIVKIVHLLDQSIRETVEITKAS